MKRFFLGLMLIGGVAAMAEEAPAPAPAPAAKPALAGWNKKFTLQSEDGRFKLNLGGRLQAYYELDQPDADTNATQFGSNFAKPVVQETSQFRIRRGRFVLDGNIYDPKLEYEVQLELAGASTTLKRAYLNYKVRDDLQIRAGRFKAPFGRQQLTSSFKQQFTERSIVTNEFTKGDDDGVMVWGLPKKGRYEYYLGVFNGDGANKNSQQDKRNQWFGRVAFSPAGRFLYSEAALGTPAKLQWTVAANASVNGGWLYEVNGKSGMQMPMETCTSAGCVTDHGDDASILFTGVDVAMKWNRASWSAEAFTRRANPRQNGLHSVTARGWYQQAGYFVVRDKSEIGVRYGVLDFDTDAVNDRATEIGAFYNHYLHGHDTKIQTDITEIRTEGTAISNAQPVELREVRARVQFVLSF